MKRRTLPKARTPRPAVSRYAAKQARLGTFGELLIAAMQTQPERLELKARLIEMMGDAA